MPIFSRTFIIPLFLVRNRFLSTVFCVTILFTGSATICLSQGQSEMRFADSPQYQSQQPMTHQQFVPQQGSREQTANRIGSMFGPNNASVAASNTVALPDSDRQPSLDIPQHQRTSGVWSLESSQRLDQINTANGQTIAQPQYTDDNQNHLSNSPIRLASVLEPETESHPNADMSPIPQLISPGEPQTAPLQLLIPKEMTNQPTVFETPITQAAFQQETFGNVANEITPAETAEVESTGTKYSDSPMPKFYAKGEQKEEATEKGGRGTFSLLPKSAPPILTVISSLAIVLGVFFILVWLMKRATPRQAGVLPQEVFEKLGSVTFSPKMQMHLFRLGGKLVLVSVTPDGMEPVAEVTDPDEVVHLIGLCKQNDPKSSSAAFRKVLKQYTGENGPQQQKQMTGNYPQQPMQQQMQQYPPQQNMQQMVRRPVGMVNTGRAYQR